jgi:predicted dehydrogenase
MKQQVCRVLLVGVGGYAHNYIKALQSLEIQGLAQFVAIVDPFPENARDWPYLKERALPRYASVEAFLEDPVEIDLAAIASPISFHAQQSCALLQAGINVLCEKPIAATIEEVQAIEAARNASGRFFEVGYQWTFSPAIQQLKADVLRGQLGQAEKLLTRVAWSRSSAYYNRNNWAGKIKNARGQAVYDSPVNNATAHYLHNMLFILGPEQSVAAHPIAITAECYRANAIENYDTACCKIETKEGPEIFFYTTHATENSEGPVFRYVFENAEVHYAYGQDIVAHFKDGTQKIYGNPEAEIMFKLQCCVERCRSAATTHDICGIEAARAHALCVDALQQVPVHTIDAAYLSSKRLGPHDTLTYLPGMESIVKEAYEAGQLFSAQHDLAWTQAPTTVRTRAAKFI